ncbi:MAG: DUF4278 domain-containing protein [Leptolyngbyaceae cyanobacterium]
MQLSYRVSHYEAEAGPVANGVQVPIIGKYRGVDFLKRSTVVTPCARSHYKYRGATY